MLLSLLDSPTWNGTTYAELIDHCIDPVIILSSYLYFQKLACSFQLEQVKWGIFFGQKWHNREILIEFLLSLRESLSSYFSIFNRKRKEVIYSKILLFMLRKYKAGEKEAKINIPVVSQKFLFHCLQKESFFWTFSNLIHPNALSPSQNSPRSCSEAMIF